MQYQQHNPTAVLSALRYIDRIDGLTSDDFPLLYHLDV